MKMWAISFAVTANNQYFHIVFFPNPFNIASLLLFTPNPAMHHGTDHLPSQNTSRHKMETDLLKK